MRPSSEFEACRATGGSWKQELATKVAPLIAFAGRSGGKRSAVARLVACEVQHVDGAVVRAQRQQLVRDAQARGRVLPQDVCDAGPQALVLEPGLLLLTLLLFGGIPVRFGPLNGLAGVKL